MTDQEIDGLKGSSFPKMSRECNHGGHLSSESLSDNENFQITFTAYKNKVKDGKRAIVRMKRPQKEDGHLGVIMSDLLRLESHLRTEQSQIMSLLASRDATISVQRQEIDRLRRDNRRLINRLKKITEGRDCSREEKVGVGGRRMELNGLFGCEKNKKISAKVFLDPHHQQPPVAGGERVARPFVKQSVMTTLTSQFYEKTALQFTDENGRIIDRVLHKPPIAEKPKTVSFARATQRVPVTAAVVRALNGSGGRIGNSQCNIVSTISRLLEEESDPGIGNGSSSGSSDEPSSPEATLKPSTPRVIKLARQYEKGLTSSGGSSSSDSGRSGDEQSVKAMVMDEYEVTSGYNSDAVSDLDHDYENVLLLRADKGRCGPRVVSGNGGRDSEEEEQNCEYDDNYVILRAVRDNHPESPSTFLTEEDDQHIYSNIEYGAKEDRHNISTERREDGDDGQKLVLITDLDESVNSQGSHEAQEGQEKVKNVPRSRHNIDLVINSSEDSRLMENFEEFTLDSLDLEELSGEGHKGKENLPLIQLRHSGDGAEAKTLSSTKEQDKAKPGLMPGQGGYEKFLEVTGLSQKSILTPSRMFSNHRSVLKPRDIKHRDKLRSAFTSLSTLEEVSPSGTPVNVPTSDFSPSSSQRYWREPYL